MHSLLGGWHGDALFVMFRTSRDGGRRLITAVLGGAVFAGATGLSPQCSGVLFSGVLPPAEPAALWGFVGSSGLIGRSGGFTAPLPDGRSSRSQAAVVLLVYGGFQALFEA